MRNHWIRIGVLGSAAFGSILWSEKKTMPVQTECGKLSQKIGDQSPYELKLVQVLFRHGARTPLKSIPDVMEAQWIPSMLRAPPHTEINYVVTDLTGGPQPPGPVEETYRNRILSGGTYPGQLTTLGMEQLYDLGRRLRKRYIEDVPFLAPEFSPAEVYVRSTNIVRTIESAKCLVAGLFHQKQKGAVPIFTTEDETEVLYPNYHGCQLLKLLGRVSDRGGVVPSGHRWADSIRLPDIAQDLKKLRGELGIAADSKADFILIRDDMVAREAHGLPCPPALYTWRETVEQRAVDMICHVFEPSTRQNLQLCVGRMINLMMVNMDSKVKGRSPDTDRKLYLFSVHDTTLMPCLMALGIFDMKWPPYAAEITLELLQHRVTKEPFVKVSYMGQDKLIPGCSGIYCPLREFQEAMSAYSLSADKYEALCNQPMQDRGADP